MKLKGVNSWNERRTIDIHFCFSNDVQRSNEVNIYIEEEREREKRREGNNEEIVYVKRGILTRLSNKH